MNNEERVLSCVERAAGIAAAVGYDAGFGLVRA